MPNRFSSCPALVESAKSFAAMLILAGAITGVGSPALAVDEASSDWPCVQRKVATITSTQIWDGPSIEGLPKKWWEDEDVRKLVPFLVSRRNPIEEVEAKIEEFAKATPDAEKSARLTLLFSGVLEETNKLRNRVLEGIETFQRRQKLRSEALEKKGLELSELHARADKGEKISAQIDEAQRVYDWDARVFKERNDNIPLACEIPVDIEQRAYAVAQTIRFHFPE